MSKEQHDDVTVLFEGKIFYDQASERGKFSHTFNKKKLFFSLHIDDARWICVSCMCVCMC